MNSRKIKRLDSGILIPSGAKDLQIRDRRAPQPKVGAGIGGWFQLELVDQRGRLAWEHQQHNLFLDSGLDRIGQSAGGGAGSVTASDLWGFAVGTGSTTPSVTDTVLDNEIARTNTQAPDSVNEVRRVADGVYELERTFQFGFGEANGNLTEIGFAWASGPGNLWMRELIRDSGGTPITLTKTSDFILRGKYVLRFTLTPTVLTPGSFTVDGWGVLNGAYMFRGGGTSGSSGLTDYKTFRRAASNNSSLDLKAVSTVPGTQYTDSNSVDNSSGNATSKSASAFVPGVWSRDISAVFGVATANTTIATLCDGRWPGWLFVIDAADRHTKDNEHTLTINRFIGVTWGRS